MKTENGIEEEAQINTTVESKAGRIWLMTVVSSSHYVCAVHLNSLDVL